MTAINLIPPEVVLGRQAQVRLRRLLTHLIEGAFLAGLLFLGLTRLVVVRERELHRMQQRHAVLQENLQSAERVLAERDFLARKYSAIAVLQGHRRAGWFLDQLGQVLPPDCYVEALELGRGDRSGEGTEGTQAPADSLAAELKVVGHARDHQEVGRLMGQLNTAGCFAEVDLVSVTDVEDAERGARVDFEIRCGPAAGKP